MGLAEIATAHRRKATQLEDALAVLALEAGLVEGLTVRVHPGYNIITMSGKGLVQFSFSHENLSMA